MGAIRTVRRRVWPWLTLLGTSLALIGGILWDVGPGLRGLTRAPVRPAGQGAPSPANTDERRAVRLFFVQADKPVLVEREEEMPRRSSVTDEVRVVLRMLAARATEELASPLPAGLEIRQIFLDSLGVLYLDCGKSVRAIATGPAGSDLAISAIVLTLAGTFSEVKRVQLLSEGEEIPLAAGGVDLRRPINPRFPGEDGPRVISPSLPETP